MKYAIIADIHANLSALKAVLQEFQKCTNIACLGDIVGYYNKPKECLDVNSESAHPMLKRKS